MSMTARGPLSALVGVALTFVPVATARATSGVDCGCATTGAYVDPAPPDTSALVVVPFTADAESPHSKYYLQVDTSTDPYVATISRHDTPSTWQAFAQFHLNHGSWWGFSPDDDRFLNVVPTTPGHEQVQVWNLPGIVAPLGLVSPDYVSPDRPSPLFTGFSPNGKQMIEAWVDYPNQASILLHDPATGIATLAHPISFTYDANLTTDKADEPRGVAAFGFSPDAGDRTLVYGWIDINGGTNLQYVNLDIASSASTPGWPAFAPSTNFTLGQVRFSPCGDILAVTSQSTDPNAKSTEIDLFHTSTGIPTLGGGPTFNGWHDPVPLQATPSSQVATIIDVLSGIPADVVLQPNTAGDACPPPLALTSFTLAMPTVVGGTPVNGTLTFSVAPTVTTPFGLSSVPGGEITGPASPAIPAHTNPYTFPIQTAENLTPDDIAADFTVTVTGSAPHTQHVTISPGPRRLQDLVFVTSPLLGGSPATLHVILNAPAANAGSGEVVRFTNPRPDLLTLADSIIVAPGATDAIITCASHALGVRDSVTIFGTCGGVTLQAKLVVRPPHAALIAFQQPCVAGGDTVDAYVKLEAPAPAGGLPVYPISYYAYVNPPAVVVVPAGEIWATFPVATTAVTRHRYVFISMTGEDSTYIENTFEVQPGNGQYVMRGLGTIAPTTFPDNPPALWSQVYGIGPNGGIAGQSDAHNSFPAVGMRWHGRHVMPVMVPGAVATRAMALNDAGTTVGGSELGPWLLEANGAMHLNVSGHGDYNDVALAINAGGDAVGGADAEVNSADAWYRASDGTVTHLPLGGGLRARARGINDSRVAVGSITDAGGALQPFRWDPVGGLTMLPLPVGATSGDALGVNNGGVICGWTSSGGTHQATAWLDGTPPTISRVDPAVAAWEHINNIGFMTAGWQIRNGDHVYNLSTLAGCDVYNLSIAGINDAGEMAVDGTDVYGDYHLAYRLSSLPTAPWMSDASPVLDAAAAIELLEPTRVRLRWAVSGLPPAIAQVQRRVPGEDWTNVGIPSAVRDAFTFQDSSLVPGRAYAFRLAVLDGGKTLYVGAVDVVTPHPAALSLLGFFPNPSRGENLSMVIVLPDAGHAAVELLDISGRRVFSRELDAADPGTMRIPLGPGAHLPPGIYLARVRQGAKTATARLTVVR